MGQWGPREQYITAMVIVGAGGGGDKGISSENFKNSKIGYK